MNKIKFLLCFALLVSGVEGRGQIYINSYRFGGPTGELLLDSFPSAAVAFSLRKLDKDYAGNCITVQKPNGDTISIGFAGNYLDTISLKTFCGTSASDTCRVRKWFDQSGNNRHCETTTFVNQPSILVSGVIFYKNNSPAIDFDGSNDFLTIPSSKAMFNFFHNGNTSFVSAVTAIDVSATGFMGNNNLAGGAIGIVFDYGIYGIQLYVASPSGISIQHARVDLSVNNNTHLFAFEIDADNATANDRAKLYINKGSVIKNNTRTGAISTSNSDSNFIIGNISENLNNPLNGSIKEILIWPTDQATNRITIRDNINAFYSIY